MAEIKLICPGCEAEYVLPQSAVPPAGRQVECSRCGLVWQAQQPDVAQPLDLTSYTLPLPPADRQPAVPPASRRLAPEVLDILREEVEHERRLRAAEDEDAPEAAAGSETDWPATTVVVPAGATRSATANPQPQVPLTAPPPAPPVIRLRPAEGPVQTPRPLAEPAHESPAARSGGRYRLGFALMVMLAAACVALYVLAPRLSEQGVIGERLAELLQGLDRARLWLDSQAARLRG